MSNRRKFIGIVLKQDEDGRLHYEAEIIPYESSQTGVRHTASEARRIALDMIRLADALDADALAQQEGSNGE